MGDTGRGGTSPLYSCNANTLNKCDWATTCEDFFEKVDHSDSSYLQSHHVWIRSRDQHNACSQCKVKAAVIHTCVIAYVL